MKPKHLKCAISWKEPKIFLEDCVWYVPDRLEDYRSFLFEGWNSPRFFGNDRPVYVEYCSGNGAWIAEKARQHPEINWVAVEIRFDRVKKIWSKMKNFGLENLRIICGSAECITQHYFSHQSIAKVFINFPDPWPKRRHAKYRIVQDAFVAEIFRILNSKGTLTVVTDDPDYSHEITTTLMRHPQFDSLHPEPYFCTHLEGYGSSYFEELWREKGKTIHYHEYQKQL